MLIGEVRIQNGTGWDEAIGKASVAVEQLHLL
jgi:hypothetical protein